MISSTLYTVIFLYEKEREKLRKYSCFDPLLLELPAATFRSLLQKFFHFQTWSFAKKFRQKRIGERSDPSEQDN